MEVANKLSEQATPLDKASILQVFFVHRRDVYSQQFPDGHYESVKNELSTSVLQAHISGKETNGTYLLDLKDTCIVGLLDFDDTTDTTTTFLLTFKRVGEHYGLKSLVEFSGRRGYHLIFFFEPMPAEKIRKLLSALEKETVEDCGFTVKLELFPKQGQLAIDKKTGEKLYGNLVKLPWGIHKRSGHRSYFVDDAFQPIANQEGLFNGITPTPEATVDEILSEIGPATEDFKPTNENHDYPKLSPEEEEVAAAKLLENCAFVQHCKNDAQTLCEPHWWTACGILHHFGDVGIAAFYELSSPYPGFSERQTQYKLTKASEKPHTCQYIQESLGFQCPPDCLAKKLHAKTPVTMAIRLIRKMPEVVANNRQLRDVRIDALDILCKGNKPEHLFQRHGTIVRIRVNEKGQPFIELLSEAALRGCMSDCCDFVAITKRREETVKTAISPPISVVRDILSLGTWELPALEGIIESPAIRPDGSIIATPGYDPTTHLYYRPAADLVIPPIPDRPTDNDARVAVRLALEPYSDFPFDSEASRANAIAAQLTPILHPMIEGTTPMGLIDKPQPGTGAGLLVEVISIIATGRPAAMTPAPENDEAMQKLITSLLIQGVELIVFDNLEGEFGSASLARALTCNQWQDRILGQSLTVNLPCRITWLATGNNVRLKGDLPRRCYWIRLDAKTPRPWLRPSNQFAHPDLMAWVRQRRGEIIAAWLTLIRCWVLEGCPKAPNAPMLGGFEDWASKMGGMLQSIAVDGFLSNLTEMYDELDREGPQWERFFKVWHDQLGDKPVTTAKLVKLFESDGLLREALPESVSDPSIKNYTRILGNAIARRNENRFDNGLMLAKAGEQKHAAEWLVTNFRTSQLLTHQV